MAPDGLKVAPTDRRSSTPWPHPALRSREFVLAILLAGLVLVAGVLEPRFVAPKAQWLLAGHAWELAIVALPMLLIVVTGGIDLSVGSTLALSAVVLGLSHERGAPPALAAALAVGVGGALGATNGWFVARLKVHPLIVTLATMAAFRGVAEGVSLARPISGYPDSLLWWSQGTILGVPVPGLVFAGLAVATAFVLRRTLVGLWLVAIGTEETAARFSGIPVARVKQGLYAACGACCGLAAVLLVARNNTAKADLGTGLELEAITAVVLGGASIEGGRGNVLGLVLGLALIHETREFVGWHWKQNELNLIVIGALLVGTVLLERLIGRTRRPRPEPVAASG
ncbi:MAG: ABC transporter permease [Fimbriimonadaceae bacterium]|nr:ABC transporter permease [Fimbriimonadaceae bacterium]